MGEPLFKATPLIKKHNIAVFRSNYSLYNSLSSRFVSVVESLSTECELYSIDEIIINSHGINDLYYFCRKHRYAVQKQTTWFVGWAQQKPKLWPNFAIMQPKHRQPMEGGGLNRPTSLMSILPASEYGVLIVESLNLYRRWA